MAIDTLLYDVYYKHMSTPYVGDFWMQILVHMEPQDLKMGRTNSKLKEIANHFNNST
jgi:hypothetical protein